MIKQGSSFKSAAEAVGLNTTSLRRWHRMLFPAPDASAEIANSEDLTNENKQLCRELQRVVVERDSLADRQLGAGSLPKEAGEGKILTKYRI